MIDKDYSYKEIVDQCVGRLIRGMEKKCPFLVVITGDSGSGKSFYSELIRKELQARSINLTYINADDFLISRASREPMKLNFYTEGEFSGKSQWEILENMFRLDEFKTVILRLKDGKDARYRPYKRETGKISDEEKTVRPSDIIIFDSSMLVELMDFVIMVDVDTETIIKRKKLRDSDVRTPEQIEEMHRKVQGYYWTRKKPAKADIVIDNNDFDHPKITIDEQSR